MTHPHNNIAFNQIINLKPVSHERCQRQVCHFRPYIEILLTLSKMEYIHKCSINEMKIGGPSANYNIRMRSKFEYSTANIQNISSLIK